MRKLEHMDIKGKKVLLRVDFNVPMDEQGEISDDSRIRAAVPTINHILDQGCAKLIIMSHMGEPDGKADPRLSLEKVAVRLSQIIERSVYKAKDCILKRVPGEKIILLENLRFHKEETENNDAFAKSLASYGDIYVNDAFGVCHRSHASVHAITKYLPGCIGFLIEKELDNLNIENMKKPICAIIGGAKLKTKIPLIQRMLTKADKVMIGGGMIFTFYAAQNLQIGESILDKGYLSNAKVMLNNENLLLPTDVVVADTETRSTQIMTVKYDAMPATSIGLDIGPQSVEHMKDALIGAKTIIWNGPLGYYEKEPFDKATKEIAEYIAQLDCVKIVGGGDTADVIHKLGLENGFTFISSGGGAALEVLSGAELPAIRALEENNR